MRTTQDLLDSLNNIYSFVYIKPVPLEDTRIKELAKELGCYIPTVFLDNESQNLVDIKEISIIVKEYPLKNKKDLATRINQIVELILRLQKEGYEVVEHRTRGN